MRMKNMIRILCLLSGWILISCYDDKGNYTYQEPGEVLPIEITGLSDTTFTVLTEVSLTPEIKGIANEADYQFTWYAYQLNATGFAPKRDTLGTTKNLSFRMEYPAGTYYRLVFEIKDKKTGVFVNKKIEFRSVSEYTDGWFVLEDENDLTDMDFVLPDGTVREDLLTAVLGERMPGKAVKLAYIARSYEHEEMGEDGTPVVLNNQQALHILTSQDMKTLNPGNMSVFKHFKDEFYLTPAVARPQNIAVDTWYADAYLINDGRLHTIYGMSQNLGKFGLGKFGHGDLASDMIMNTATSVMVFSRETKSFVYVDTWTDSMAEFLEESNSGNRVGIATSYMDADLIRLLERRNEGGSGVKAWALMKGISEPGKFYLADINFTGQNYPFVDFDEISPDRAICQADVYGAHQVNTIYFAKGNVLSYYQKNASDAESLEKPNLYPFPEGETISYITQIDVPDDSEEKYQSNLVVLTNSTAGWKLYRFRLEGNGLSPNLMEGSKPIVYKGKGNARYVMYMN